MKKEKIAVSACLLGYNCKYNGGNNRDEKVLEYIKDYDYIVVCPETAGKLPIPRVPSEIEIGCCGQDIWDENKKSKVYSKTGEDLTQNFIDGSLITLEAIKKNGIKKALLKESSPSCGVNTIYTGEFCGEKKRGQGVTAALLLENGIELISEKDI